MNNISNFHIIFLNSSITAFDYASNFYFNTCICLDQISLFTEMICVKFPEERSHFKHSARFDFTRAEFEFNAMSISLIKIRIISDYHMQFLFNSFQTIRLQNRNFQQIYLLSTYSSKGVK